jgi:putative protease
MITPKTIRKVELLAPAKDAETGKEAVLHGADAVYIGAPKFGARAAAGVSLSDIAELTEFAHRFDARVYVALNTILFDDEIGEVQQMAYSLYNIGVDALIVQDFSFFDLDLPPIALHASTQMDNRSVEKVQLLERLGCEQVVLARELPLAKIREMAASTSAALEVFVHGALCVSYSGQCYVSQAYCGRSANRGVCAQFCRLPYTLEDNNGNVLCENRHLLSLKDLNRSADLEALLDAGVTSFKIEGRLKEVSYVKNVTAYYRNALDAIIARRKGEFARSSAGNSEYTFIPGPKQSFNRGFVHYFLNDREKPLISSATPTSVGEKAGTVTRVERDHFTLDSPHTFTNGDGLCYFTDGGAFEGFRLNRVEGARFFPLGNPPLREGMTLYRNHNKAFEDALAKKSADRRISVQLTLRACRWGVVLDAADESGCSVSLAREWPIEPAKTNQTEQQSRVLLKTGDTIYKVCRLDLTDCSELFLPASFLTALRRDALAALDRSRRIRRDLRLRKAQATENDPPLLNVLPSDYRANVANHSAHDFYIHHGKEVVAPAFELQECGGEALMTTKYCLLYELGKCKKTTPRREQLSCPLFLRHKQGRLRVETDCTLCEMRLYKD